MVQQPPDFPTHSRSALRTRQVFQLEVPHPIALGAVIVRDHLGLSPSTTYFWQSGRRWGDSRVVSRSLPQVLWGVGLQVQKPVVFECGATMGREVRRLLDHDLCPAVKRGEPPLTAPVCNKCGANESIQALSSKPSCKGLIVLTVATAIAVDETIEERLTAVEEADASRSTDNEPPNRIGSSRLSVGFQDEPAFEEVLHLWPRNLSGRVSCWLRTSIRESICSMDLGVPSIAVSRGLVFLTRNSAELRQGFLVWSRRDWTMELVGTPQWVRANRSTVSHLRPAHPCSQINSRPGRSGRSTCC